MTDSPLFQPTAPGPLSLRNRIAMAPLTRSRATGNLPNALMREYYGQRASAGLVLLLEHTEQLRAFAVEDFKAVMEVLQSASLEWARMQLPLWSFIALDETEFDAIG
jgi:2,4-dienoyl-CoA reductase-like NADH-dependent reductase (Old Yellow Enzyme family)